MSAMQTLPTLIIKSTGEDIKRLMLTALPGILRTVWLH